MHAALRCSPLDFLGVQKVVISSAAPENENVCAMSLALLKLLTALLYVVAHAAERGKPRAGAHHYYRRARILRQFKSGPSQEPAHDARVPYKYCNIASVFVLLY